MPDISQYLKQAEELDKKKGITPAQTARSGPDLTQYLKQAEALDSARATAQKTTNTTRAVGAGVGGRVPEIQLPRLNINAFGAGSYGAPKVADTAQRIGKTVAAAGTGAAGNYAEALGQITTPQGLTIGESARVALQGGTRAQERAAEQAKAQRIQENIKDPLQAYSDKMAKKSAALTEEAKAGLGKVGQFAVDLGVTGTQMLGDMALGLVNPALGTAAMGTRVFGGSAQEARQSGATETQQQLYGLTSAAVSVGVEKLSQVGGLFNRAYGGSIAGGSVDDILIKLTGKLIKNPVGQRMLASAAGEAGEEALEALVKPALQAIYDKGASLNETWFGDKEQLTEYLAEVGYNALLGGALGTVGAGVNILAQKAPQTAQDGATAAQTAADASVAGSETPAAQNGAERPQNAAQEAQGGQTSPAWGRYMEEGGLFGGGKVREGFTSMENAVANQFERDTGISIEAVESILGGLANGEYDAANWVAKIARDAKDPKMVVMAHELTHHLQTLAPQEYESFRTAVADYFTRAGGETALADMMSRYRNAYGEAGQNLSDNAVMDEIAADFTQVLLEDADLFGRFVQENRTVAERLLDALKALIEKIRATFTGRARDAAAQEATGRTLSELEQIAGQWQSVYNAATAAYGQNANTATQESDGVRYSIKFPTFSEADIKENSIKLQTMDSVETLTGNELGEQSVPLGIRVRKYFESLGNNVYTDRFGDVSLANSSVHSEFRHGNTPPKVMTYAAVPAVLKKGVVIYQIKKNKHGLERIVVAAPVKVGTPAETMYVGVMLQRDPQNQRLYLHDVVTEKELSAESDGHLIPTGPNTSNGELHTTYILRNALKVKGNMAQLKATAPLRQMMRDLRMPQLTTVEQDMAAAEAAPVEDAPAVENEVQLPQLGLTDADAPGTEPLTRQDVAREMAWRSRMANEPVPPQAMQEIQLPQLSADIEEAGMGVADFTGNVEMTPEAASAEIDQAMEELYQSLDATMETPTDAAERDERQKISRVEGLVSAQTAAENKTLREKAAESWSFFKRKMVDAGDAVTRIGKAVGDSYLYPFYNMARSSASAGANMIAQEQTDVNGNPVGESLNAIFDPIRAKGEEYYTRFQTYMYDLHNIARMSMDERAKAAQEKAKAARAAFAADHPEFLNMTEAEVQKQALSTDELKAEDAKEYLRLIRWVNRTNRMGNKAVFDWEWTAEDSRGRSERLLRENPEFAQYRDQVRKYIDNLMQYRVDSGLITQKDADFLRDYYPDYVPTKYQQAKDHFAETGEKRQVIIGKTVGRARGGGGEEKLLPLHEALGKQTMQVVREGSKNRFGRRLLADYMETPNDPGVAKHITNAEEYDADFSIDSLDAEEDTTFKGNTFSVYSDGKLYEMTVDGAMLEAVKALSPDAAEQNSVVKAVRSINKVYKAMLTGYNPTFAIRNTVRDLQTAGLYSRDFSAWAKNYPKALQEIKRDGPMWKQYKALGGDFSSVFDYATGTVRKPTTKVGKMADRMQAINMAMEQAPRLAEFMSVMEKGDGSMETAMDAMLAAADVTVNFGRSGTWGKWLNANYVPFLNPGIQGFDKMVRYATQTRSGKQWLMMAVRAAALGIAPSLINALLYHDDEEWEELRDSDKDTNYMFKIRDGLWLKIPKGRELSVLGITADRVGDALRGEDVDLRGALNTMANQVAPANPLKTNILTPMIDTRLWDASDPGRTWYGGDIESQRLQNYAPGQRYDSSTDIVSKAVGGALNLSPAKINYLLDQYSGVAGDIVLPLLTPQAERDMFSKAFTVDSISSNELSGKFYDAADELTYAKNGGDRTAEVVSRYWNRVSSEVSALYGEIRRVEESDLSNRQKKEQVQQLRQQINALQRQALATKEQYTAAAEGNLFAQTDEAKDYAYRETNREVFGAEYALETYDKNVYAKAKEAVAGGASYEGYYDYYFSTQGDGTAEKLSYLQHSGLNAKEQSAIFYAAIASDSDTATQKETGLSKEQYYLYRAATYGIEGDRDATGKTIPGSKKEKMLQAIDGLDLTVPQKDALYFANGYAKSTLYDAPWYNIVPRL